jgi:cell division protein ZapA
MDNAEVIDQLRAIAARVEVLAALNMAHELQQMRDGSAGHDAELAHALEGLRRRLDGLEI